ncbi:MAG: hypothetical protein ACTHMA_21055 [Thermomicrobiales bacterium]
METPDSLAPSAPPSEDGDAVGSLLMQQAAEVAALRARLRDVEAALDLPTRPGRPAPSTLPALLHRVAVLERHAALKPGLDPLPQDRPATTSTPGAAPPATARAAWREWGQALAGVALALALLAWLLYPAQPGTRTPPAAAVPPTAVATSAAAAVPAAPPPPASGAQPVPPPAPVVECPLTMVGSCYGQWTASSCVAGMSPDDLAALGVCAEGLPAPLAAP